MQERVCPGCGAINRLSAESCWRCLAALPEPQDQPAAAAESHVATA